MLTTKRSLADCQVGDTLGSYAKVGGEAIAGCPPTVLGQRFLGRHLEVWQRCPAPRQGGFVPIDLDSTKDASTDDNDGNGPNIIGKGF